MRVVFEDDDPSRVKSAARECAALLEKPAQAENVSLLGPAEAPLALLRGRTRWHMLSQGRRRRPRPRAACAHCCCKTGSTRIRGRRS
jgi:primosomal protein N'